MMKPFALFICSLILLSCEKQENYEFTDTPIIETYLYPGDHPQLYISRQVPFLDDVTYSDDDLWQLNVTFTINDITYFPECIGEGVYIDTNVSVTTADTVYFAFQFNNLPVEGHTYIPAKPLYMELSETEMYLDKRDSTTFGPPGQSSQPDPIVVNWENLDNSYYLLLVENIESNPEPVIDFGDDEDPPNFVFRKSPRNDNSEQISSRDFQYFGTHRVILYHVLPDYAKLYEESNNSSQNLENPSSSIINGYGIFTGINADTAYIEVIKN